MNTEAVDAAFAEMINRRMIYKELGLSANLVHQYRYQLKHGIPISLEKKIELLKKSGWKEDDTKYSRADLLSLVKFVLKTSAKAREFGPEYLVEKWESRK